MAFLLVVLCLVTAGEALIPHQPRVTAPNWDIDSLANGWTPRPTDGPELKDIVRRFGPASSIVSTIGWINGDVNSPIGCNAGGYWLVYNSQ